MVIAYILITSKSGGEKNVLESLQKLEEIAEAKIVYGEYDIIAKIQTGDVDKLNDFLLEKIRQISDIEKTSTLIVAA